MKNRSSRIAIIAVGLLACAINTVFLIPNFWKAVVSFKASMDLSNVQRSYLQWGEWYRVVLDVQNAIPPNATVRFVSPNPPWYLVYYLYPRILKAGSNDLSQRQSIRKNYPHDWVLVYSEGNPHEVTVYPPVETHG